MKIINNIDLINNNLLTFNSNDEFYFLQIIQRKKDGNKNVIDSMRNGYRTIKSYYIRSHEELERRKEKIISLCENNNARAYININKRSAKEVTWNLGIEALTLYKEDRANHIFNLFDHICGTTPSSKSELLWIVDLDSQDIDYINKVKEILNEVRGNPNRIRLEVPTLHGLHLITGKFDVKQFNQHMLMNKLDIIEIKRDNPTLLYYKENDK